MPIFACNSSSLVDGCSAGLRRLWSELKSSSPVRGRRPTPHPHSTGTPGGRSHRPGNSAGAVPGDGPSSGTPGVHEELQAGVLGPAPPPARPPDRRLASSSRPTSPGSRLGALSARSGFPPSRDSVPRRRGQQTRQGRTAPADHWDLRRQLVHRFLPAGHDTDRRPPIPAPGLVALSRQRCEYVSAYYALRLEGRAARGLIDKAGPSFCSSPKIHPPPCHQR